MGKLVLHNEPDVEKQNLERAKLFAALPFEEKMNRLFTLIDLAVKMNGGRSIKHPQGKGLVIRKPKH